MSYFSKHTILSAYKVLSTLSTDYTVQGATQKVSAIRYLLATNAFYKKFDRPCDKNNNDDAKFFIDEVGRVVAVNENYSTNFAVPLKDNQDFAVGSNFFSVNVVKNSQLSPDKFFDFPKRTSPLIKVKAEKLYYDKSLLTNLKSYIYEVKHKYALMVWLARNEPISPKNFFEDITNYMLRIYTSDLANALLVTLTEFNNCQHSIFPLEFSDTIDEIKNQDIVNLFDVKDDIEHPCKSMTHNSNTILYGPPGTGKTFDMQKEFSKYPDSNRSMITFHQSYSYEEFIIGLKAITDESGNIRYKYEKGIFYNACETAARLAGYSSLSECCSDAKDSRKTKFAAIAEDQSREFLFCIDEINRANVSAVFGDLISLIEESKRLGAENEMIVKLPYTQDLFGVPANLRLIGTMNTADRSIQILDTALRRRFQFKEYLPDYNVLENEKARTILRTINDRIRALLNNDRQIGQSYFCDIEAGAADENIQILKALANKIIPLLQEYFYNDVEKVRFVLGERDKITNGQPFYIEDTSASSAFSLYDPDSEDIHFYTLNTNGITKALTKDEIASEFIDHIIE